MQYSFHISDGPKVVSDEVGKNLSTSVEAIQQAKFLVAEEGWQVLRVKSRIRYGRGRPPNL
jgi:hypothetical protein